MADSVIDSEYITLEDNWPGVARILGGNQEPQGDIVGSGHHNVETAIYKTGYKVSLWNDGDTAGISGWCTFVYLQVGTQNAAVAIAAKSICTPDSATLWYQVTNDPDTAVLHTGPALACVALSAMTDAYWGWFWCGGPAPEALISGMGGTYLADGNVIAGSIVVHNMNPIDEMGFGPCGADTEHSIGLALAADVA